MNEPERRYCPDDFPCCVSCHDDLNVYGYDLMTVELPDGSVAEVCCTVALLLEAMR